MKSPLSIVQRLRLSEANQKIILTTRPVRVVRFKARIPWITFADPLNPPSDPLTSTLRVNDYFEIPLTPEDVAEGVPSLQWEELPIMFDAEKGMWVFWDVNFPPDVVDALLEIQVAGYGKPNP